MVTMVFFTLSWILWTQLSLSQCRTLAPEPQDCTILPAQAIEKREAYADGFPCLDAMRLQIRRDRLVAETMAMRQARYERQYWCLPEVMSPGDTTPDLTMGYATEGGVQCRGIQWLVDACVQ